MHNIYSLTETVVIAITTLTIAYMIYHGLNK